MQDLLTKPALDESYHCGLELAADPIEVAAAIDRVSDWWSVYTTGDADGAGKEFTVRFGDGASDTFVAFRVAEHLSGKRIAWQVTNCFLPWLEDKTEWTGTTAQFKLTANERGTILEFTHVGLVPQVECYAGCVKGWDQYILGSLRQLIETGAGKPN